MIPLPTLLNVMLPIVRKTMLEEFRPDCCVATCKILREVFTEYDYRARQVPVAVDVLNAEMQVLVQEGPLPDDRTERLALFKRRGAWGVGVGYGPPTDANKYAGHLVLNVNGVLVDGSLDQAERKEKRILLPSLLWFKPAPGFFAPRAKGQQSSGMIGDCRVTYRRIRNDSYLTGKNWREKYAGKPETYLKIVRLLREKLALDVYAPVR